MGLSLLLTSVGWAGRAPSVLTKELRVGLNSVSEDDCPPASIWLTAKTRSAAVVVRVGTAIAFETDFAISISH
jgi:hypothetical protein